jgi:hypothetical protein
MKKKKNKTKNTHTDIRTNKIPHKKSKNKRMQIYFTNNMVEATGIKDEWERVEKVIRAHMTNKDPEFQELALCIGKYDYYDAPTNWELEYKHEVVLEKWTQWAIQHREEYYDALITKMLQDYREGKIPYGGDLMFGYFA